MPEPTWEYKPAADLNVPPLERFRSVRREAGLLSWCAHHAAGAALRTYLALYHRLRITGAEHLPRSAPFVLVANHASHLDALILSATLPRVVRGVTYPVAAGDVFFTTLATSVLSSLFINALPLWRKKATAHALEDLRERLGAGDCGFILFPEGSRTRDGVLQVFKPGIGRLVCGTQVPVVPCYLQGAFRALPPGASVPRPRRITVRVGHPLSFASAPNERAGWNLAASEIRRAIESLGGLTSTPNVAHGNEAADVPADGPTRPSV